MAETFAPLFLTPEHDLIIRTDLDCVSSDRHNRDIIDNARRGFERAGDFEDIDIAGDYGVITTVVDTQAFLRADSDDYAPIEERSTVLKELLQDLVIGPRDYQEKRDLVFELSMTRPRGYVHEQMQRWLNAGGVTEEVARKCLDAMAIPLVQRNGEEVGAEAEILKFDEGLLAESRAGVRLNLRPELFSIPEASQADGDDAPTELAWLSPQLQTSGDSTTFGARASDRRNVGLDPSSKRLYQIFESNVDYPHQAISLILGMSALAFEAAKYEGAEDVFAQTAA